MTEFYDNTKLSEFEKCRRKYYLRHERGWTTTRPSPPLVFGASWHSAMDVVWKGINKDRIRDDMELTQGAFYAGFMPTWIEQGFPDLVDMDPMFEDYIGLRHPSTAVRMILDYVKRWRPLIEEVELLSIEQPFAVPLWPDREDVFYCGRHDKRVRDHEGVWVIEHKTSTLYAKEGGLRPVFRESFNPNSQIEGYLYSGHLEYPDDFRGVKVDAALVHKNVSHFEHIRIERKLDHLDAWLYETREKINDLLLERQRHAEYLANPKTFSYMPSFRKNTNSCQDFNQNCVFIDVCQSGDNPASINHVPMDFKIEFWSPFDELHLEQIGLSK